MINKRVNKPVSIFVIALLAVIPVTGCNKKDDGQSPSQPQKAAQPKPSAKAALSAVQNAVSTSKGTPVTVTSVNFKNKKDPFKPLITAPEPAAAKNAVIEKVKIVNALPIQSHDTNKFVVTGIITGLRENKALLIDPLGKGYVVKNGMFVGSNGGRITKISSSSVEVSEQYRDDKGRTYTRKVLLPLAKKSKETSR